MCLCGWWLMKASEAEVFSVTRFTLPAQPFARSLDFALQGQLHFQSNGVAHLILDERSN